MGLGVDMVEQGGVLDCSHQGLGDNCASTSRIDIYIN